MAKSYCGVNCDECMLRESCSGCEVTGGRPFGGTCVRAECCKGKGLAVCPECSAYCALEQAAIAEFNALNIPDMDTVTDLHSLPGYYIDMEYTLPGGQTTTFWDKSKIYMGNQMQKRGTDRCYGIVASEEYLMVCEYSAEGSDPQIILFKKRG